MPGRYLRVIILVVAAAAAARAAVITYLDRTTWTPQVTGLTMIDFEGIATPGGSQSFSTSAGYSDSGVTFVGGCTGNCGSTSTPYYTFILDSAFSSPQYDYGTGDSLQGPAPREGASPGINIQLPAGITAVGMDLFSIHFGGGTSIGQLNISVTTASGTDTFSVMTQARPNHPFIGFTSDLPITGLRVATDAGYPLEYPEIDRFSFGQGPETIPEPSTLVLLGLGLLGAAVLGRRA